MRIVYQWLTELVDVPGDPHAIAHEIGLRGFEVAAVEDGRIPVIDFEITANRPDALSHVGIAREASVVWGKPLRMPELAPIRTDGQSPVEVELRDPDLCPRYCAQVFDVTIAPSPAWLADRLDAAGVRPINNIVDVTNYVMLEFGQPMHAFDFDRVAGGRLVIRRATRGETLRTLDGVDRALDADMLMIADADRASALGGVMGGGDSEISSTTKRIVLESAYFQPASVRRTSKRLGLKTEASTRFERGADINAPPVGIARAAALFTKLKAGTAVGPLVDRYPSPRPAVGVTLRASRIARLLGQHVPAADVPRILQPLGFRVTEDASGREQRWDVTVPSFRVDVLREADLIEEVGRHYGFDRIPATFPALAAPQAAPAATISHTRLARQILTASGFSEAMTFAFIERAAAMPFCEPGVEPAAIANPLSEKFAVLRPSLLPGLLDACSHNRRRARKEVRLFEIGSRFTSRGEGRAAAFAWAGSADPLHWSRPARTVDFFDVKGIVEALCHGFGFAAEFATTECPYLVRGRTAEVRRGADVIGIVGQVLPRVVEAREFPANEEVYVAELDLQMLAAASTGDNLRARSLPRYPSVVRDISVLIADTLPAAIVRGTIRAAAPETLESIAEFDRYHGKGVPEGRVSLSLRLTFRSNERTLTDAEVQDAADKIVAALKREHGAEQR